MSVLAISETIGSLGNEIGRRVAETLGHTFASREIIAKAAERYGEGVMDLTHVTEEKPTLWERFAETQRRYVTYVKAVVFEMAAQGDVVLSGRASTLFLGDIRHVVRVRVIAPESVRADRLQHEQGLTREAALDYIHHHDRERAARVKFLYHVDWNDPLLYDLVVNTERLSIDAGARLVLELQRNERFQPTDASRQDLLDRGLAAQALAALLHDPATRNQHLGVTCEHGCIRLTGTVRDAAYRETAERAVAGLAGVRRVENEIAVFPQYRGSMGGL